MKRTSGFTLVELVIAVAVFALLGWLGYNYFTRANQASTNTNNSVSTVTAPLPGAPEITQTSDLDLAGNVLDQINPDDAGSDLGQLEADLATF